VSWTLSRYIGARFLQTLGWAALAVASLIVLLNMLELLRSNGEGRASFLQLLSIAALKTPAIGLTAAPFVIMLATLACFARLARSSELVVTRAAGVSVWALIAPVLAATLTLGCLTFAVFNPLAAAATLRAETLEARHLEGRVSRLSLSREGLWLRQGDGPAEGQTVIHARAADGRASVLRDVTLFGFDSGGALTTRVDAAYAVLTPGAWVLRDGVRRDLTAEERLAAADERFERLETPTDLTSAQILDSFEAPEAIPFWQLPGFIATLEASGFSAVRHRLHWQSQLAAPVLFAGMALIGAAFSMRHARLGGLGTMALAAVLSGFGFFFLFDVAKALGASGAIPVALAAWAPPASAALLAAGLLLHLEDG
jgi:lipopolysaccharide export system permease protein